MSSPAVSSPAVSRRRPFPHPVHVPGDGIAPAAVLPVQPLPDGAPTTARYRYDPRSDTWWWSPEMFAVLGLAAGAAEPSSRLLLDALESGDRARTAQALARAGSGTPFAVENRVVRGDGALRTVVVVGEPQRDAMGAVSAVDGMCVDFTDGRRAAEADRVAALETEVAQMRTAMASRAAIEQAKGILMLLTGCGDQVAFELLAHISSHTHRKVREVAVAITESASGHGNLPDDVRAIIRDACPPARGH